MLLAGVIDGQQVLSSPFVPSDHPAGDSGGPRHQIVLGVHLSPNPEHPAHVDSVADHVPLVYPEHVGEGATSEMDELGHPPQMELAIGPLGDQLTGFDRKAGSPRGVEVEFEDHVCVGEDLFDPAIHGRDFEVQTLMIAIPHPGRLRARCVSDRREHVEFDPDRVRAISCRSRGVSHDHSDRLADVSDSIHGNDRLQS